MRGLDHISTPTDGLGAYRVWVYEKPGSGLGAGSGSVIPGRKGA
jgi:hypothetical protein